MEVQNCRFDRNTAGHDGGAFMMQVRGLKSIRLV